MERGKSGENLIVALDFPEGTEALSLVELLLPDVRFFKVGLELFVASGPSIVRKIKEKGARVFLDLKFHDIPNTVKGAVACATRLGADIISVHLSMGVEGVMGAREGLNDGSSVLEKQPLVAGVTVLTSLGGQESDRKTGSVLDEVLRLSRLARDCGLGGVITSVREAAEVRRTVGPGCAIITPGIRLTATVNDHKRVGTVRDAIGAGANYLVVGRPITRAPDPRKEAREFLEQIAAFSTKRQSDG